jgi:hypothetical protein
MLKNYWRVRACSASALNQIEYIVSPRLKPHLFLMSAAEADVSDAAPDAIALGYEGKGEGGQ